MRVTREGTPLGRNAVSDLLREEGFGRLVRGAAPEASTSPSTSGRDTRLPAASVIDFGSVPPRAPTAMAGLLLTVPDLVALDLPGLADEAGYSGTRVIPAVSWLLSLLALKLTATRRVSHVDDLLADPAPALLAGLAVLPKKTALTDYSYRLSHDHQLRFLAALDKQMIGSGLAAADEAIFDLDFHAVMHWGHDPALEKHDVPTRSQRARSVLTFFAHNLKPAIMRRCGWMAWPRAGLALELFAQSQRLEEVQEAVLGLVASRGCARRRGPGERPFLERQVARTGDLGGPNTFVAKP